MVMMVMMMVAAVVVMMMVTMTMMMITPMLCDRWRRAATSASRRRCGHSWPSPTITAGWTTARCAISSSPWTPVVGSPREWSWRGMRKLLKQYNKYNKTNPLHFSNGLGVATLTNGLSEVAGKLFTDVWTSGYPWQGFACGSGCGRIRDHHKHKVLREGSHFVSHPLWW